MDIALCYENVVPARGGCETYIADLARKLVADHHDVHLYACQWDETALPAALHYHRLPPVLGARFLRPWRFSDLCLGALRNATHDVSIGFDKTWGQDILMPLGGLHAASVERNIGKHSSRMTRFAARAAKHVDLAHLSFSRLERRQYLGNPRPQIVVPSEMVGRHFERYGVEARATHVVHCAIDPDRFPEHDRPRRRLECREQWGIAPGETVGLMVAKNYRLKGLEPLLHAIERMFARSDVPQGKGVFRLLVTGNSKLRRYRRLARQLGIYDNVRFVGECPDIRDAYFAADFLVHPTFYDPCSLVVLEALACGLPVITSRYNGASELLHPPREGFVIENPHNHDELAWCLARMLDPGRRAACAQAARRAAAAWTFADHYQKLLTILQNAARGKQAAA